MRYFLEQTVDLYMDAIDTLADFLHVNSLVALFLVICVLCSMCFLGGYYWGGLRSGLVAVMILMITLNLYHILILLVVRFL